MVVKFRGFVYTKYIRLKEQDGIIVKDEQVLKQIARYMFLVTVLLVFFVIALEHRVEQENPKELEKQQLVQEGTDKIELPSPTPMPDGVEVVSRGGHATEEDVWELWQFLQHASMEEMFPQFAPRCILIKKPAGDSTFVVEEDIITHSFRFLLEHPSEYLHAAAVLRLHEDRYYYGIPEETEFLTDFGVLNYEEEGNYITEFSFVTDGYFIPQVIEEEEYYIVNLVNYKDVYDKIVVLDAGHGGKDAGAGAENYRVKESTLTLKMVLYLKEMLEEQTDITVLCTRTENVTLELYQRVELALGVDADLFVSFHCNASESKARNGTEVIYNKLQGEGDAFTSRDFAKLCLKKMVGVLGTKNGGIMDRQDLHIVRRATMPVVLLETAYLSNEKDLALLKDDQKLQEIAGAIYEAILEAYEIMEEKEVE